MAKTENEKCNDWIKRVIRYANRRLRAAIEKEEKKKKETDGGSKRD